MKNKNNRLFGYFCENGHNTDTLYEIFTEYLKQLSSDTVVIITPRHKRIRNPTH